MVRFLAPLHRQNSPSRGYTRREAEVVHARTENLQARHETLRLACADFTTAIALTTNLAIEVMKVPGDHPEDIYREPEDWVGPSVTRVVERDKPF
jgi:hypothetical protein